MLLEIVDLERCRMILQMHLHVGRWMSERDVVGSSSMGVAVKGDFAQLFSESQKELFPGRGTVPRSWIIWERRAIGLSR